MKGGTKHRAQEAAPGHRDTSAPASGRWSGPEGLAQAPGVFGTQKAHFSLSPGSVSKRP